MKALDLAASAFVVIGAVCIGLAFVLAGLAGVVHFLVAAGGACIAGFIAHNVLGAHGVRRARR